MMISRFLHSFLAIRVALRYICQMLRMRASFALTGEGFVAAEASAAAKSATTTKMSSTQGARFPTSFQIPSM
jgi:hypothetical protein